MNLEKIFNPKSIAIVGASKEEGKIGQVVAKNILELGYAGEVFLVNPKYGEIFEKKCYKSLAEIFADGPASSTDKIDLAIIIIPAKFVNKEIENSANNIKNYVVISAGFSETDADGKEREKELLEIAEKNKLNILGPNCLGFIAPKIKLNASFAGGMPESGNIAFVSQSGALVVALMDMAKKEGMKFSNIVSIGNKMEISETEMLEYLAEDENTKVIGMYLEGIKDGKEFIEKARKVSKTKPIVILKAGKNKKTQRAISSHTGALAGDDDVVSAVLEKAGVIRVDNLREFFNILSLASFSKGIANEKIAVITNAGGAGVLTADAFNGKNIKLAEFSEEVKNKLREKLPAESSVENPIDLLGDAKADRYKNVLEIISKIEEIGSVVCLLTPQDQTPVNEIAGEIIKFSQKTDKLVVAVFLGGEKVEKAILKMKKNGIGNFDFPEDAISAINKYYFWEKAKRNRVKTETQMVNGKRREKVLKIIEKAKAEKRKALYFSESAEILEMYQIDSIRSIEIGQGKKISAVKFPVVLKIDSDKVLHKTDRQGVVLDIKNEKQLWEELRKMKANFLEEGKFIVQPMAEKGTEIIVGIKKDENFGPVMVYGLGGIYTEIFKIAERLVPPLNLSQIENSILTGKLKFLFKITRGQKGHNLEEMARIILGIGALALEIPEIKEFDINPLIMYNNGKKAIALDVKIVV